VTNTRPKRLPIDWPTIDPLLGTMTDAALSKQTGVPELTILRRRKRLGVRSFAHQRIIAEAVSPQHLYTNKYRPPGYATLPAGWNLVERPANPAFGFERRADLPVSKYPFGLVSFDRPLTPAEVEAYELEQVR